MSKAKKDRAPQKLKSLETKLKQLKAELMRLKEERKAVDVTIEIKSLEIKTIKQEITDLSQYSNNVIVSEHALLRYLQRIEKMEMKSMQNALLPDSVQDSIRVLGDGKYPVESPDGKNYTLVVKNNVVVTIEY